MGVHWLNLETGAPSLPEQPDNVVYLPGCEDALDVAPTVDVALDLARMVGLEDIVIIGRRKNGIFYFDSSTDDTYYVNWLLDVMKAKMV